MRQNSFLVDALARLALKWTTDRGDWRERPMSAAAGSDEEKGKRKQFGPRRHSTNGSGRVVADRHKDQGQGEKLSIEQDLVESFLSSAAGQL